MLTKMLIVDDEPIICQGLKYTIPWDTLGIEVIGEAYDGMEALKIIQDHSVDLVLTDIRMPVMDGLGLSQVLQTQFPDVRVIMISGYEEFDYARQAMRLGVEDYLLKPVDVDELMKLITKIRDEIMQQKKNIENRQKEQLAQWVSYLVKGIKIPPEWMENFTGFPDYPRYRAFLSQLDDYCTLSLTYKEEELNKIRVKWKHHLDETMQEQGISNLSFFLHPNLLFCICFCPEESACLDMELTSILTLIRNTWQGPSQLYFGISSPFRNFANVRDAYLEALSVINQKIIRQENILIFDETTNRLTQNRSYPRDAEEQLINALFQQNLTDVNQILEELFGEFQRQQFSFKEIQQVMEEMRLMIVRRLRSIDMKIAKEIESFSFLQVDLQVYNSYEGWKNLAQGHIGNFLNVMKSFQAGKHHWVIERVKQYLLVHYQQDLKAADIAEWLHITPNYFSVIFKQETGKSFTEYLNELRIEKAKSLLKETPNRVFEIAQKVGYKEYKYFAYVFKKITGMTPTDFRDMTTKIQGELHPATVPGDVHSTLIDK